MVEKEFISYMSDIVFKHLMITHKKFFAYIINMVLPNLSVDKILEGSVENVELYLKSLKHKSKRVDIFYKIDNILINIEANNKHSLANTRKNLGYVAELFLKYQNNDENKIYKCIQINIDNFNYYGNNVSNRYALINKEENIEHEFFGEIYHINLAKVRKIEYTKSVSKAMKCLKLLSARSNEEVNEIIKDDEYMKGVVDEMLRFINDAPLVRTEEEYQRFLAEEREELLNNAKTEGLEQGMKQGTIDANMNTARNMLKKNYSIETISELTTLPISKIKTLM